jgi:aminopeptidase N
MPPIDEKLDPEKGMKTVKFDQTPIMSTYLLAFVIGEFDYVEGITSKVIRQFFCQCIFIVVFVL